jgi:hypothetical protein
MAPTDCTARDIGACARRDEFERHCSSPGKKAESGVDVGRQRPRRDQGIRVAGEGRPDDLEQLRHTGEHRQIRRGAPAG